MGLLDGDLAQSIYDGFKGRLLTGIIRQEAVPVSGGLDGKGDPVELTPADTAIEGFYEDYDAMYLARSGLPKESVKVSIFAKSAPTIIPKRDDKVRLDQAGVETWYQLRRVQTDPAKALWTCPDAFVISAPDEDPAT